VLNGEQGYEYVTQNFKNAKIRVVQGSDDTLPLVEVLAGRADIGLHESVVVSRFVAEHSDELVDVFATNPYNPVQIAWAMRSDDMAFVHFISTTISVMETSGKINEFESNYDIYWFRQKMELVTP
jgi:ABC-type amino acid transport substrate-binding protein